MGLGLGLELVELSNGGSEEELGFGELGVRERGSLEAEVGVSAGGGDS